MVSLSLHVNVLKQTTDASFLPSSFDSVYTLQLKQHYEIACESDHHLSVSSYELPTRIFLIVVLEI
jgi:hypothetical protein